MRHRLKHHLFDREKSRQKARIPSTFTHSYNGKNPHLTKTNKLHSKSTHFYRWGSRLNYVVPSMCALALLMGGIICINPALDNSKAYAEELDFDATDNVSTDAASTDTTNADSGIMTASDPSITLDITPDSGNTNKNVEVGTVAYFSNTITVGGAGIRAYYLALSTPNGSSGNLVGKEHPASTVGKVSANTAPADFENNTWGYAISANTNVANDSLLYNPVPSGTIGNNMDYLAFRGAPTINGDKYKLVFAAKLGSNLPGDHYQSSVYISAVADAGMTSFLGFTNKNKETILTMQEMSTSFCTNVEIGQEGKLIDSRDSKIYYVAKLADHNCWMTQNLAYDGGGTQQCDLNNGGSCSGWPNQSGIDNKARYAKRTHIDGDHASQGNLYSWEAAVNGNTNTTEPKQGVCPDKWQLPTSGNTNSKSFGGLTKAYSIGDNSAGSTILRGSPLYFQYGGYIDGYLANVNSTGVYWSSTPQNADSAYSLTFGSNIVVPSNTPRRYIGYSVRCVAQ